MGASTRRLMDLPASAGRKMYEQRGASKSVVPTPSPLERVGTDGACLYACQRGHVWMVFMVRSADGFEPRDGGDRYCEKMPCVDKSDADALGRKVTPTRYWRRR